VTSRKRYFYTGKRQKKMSLYVYEEKHILTFLLLRMRKESKETTEEDRQKEMALRSVVSCVGYRKRKAWCRAAGVMDGED
jgi:hypothetical protein